MPGTFEATDDLTIILIESDETYRGLMRKSLERVPSARRGLIVREYSEAHEALTDLPPDGQAVIVCGEKSNNASGFDRLPEFIRADVGPVILVTSHWDERSAAEALRVGAADSIDKPTAIENPAALGKSISGALRRYHLERSSRDLTKRLMLANKELEQKNTTIAEMTVTTHRFVDDVAHEFRTPLTVIKEFASILADGIGGETTEQQDEYLGFIADATNDLAGLVDDFLDSSRLRARTLRVDRREHDPVELVESAWQTLHTRAASKHIRLTRTIDDELPSVYVDRDKFRRSLINLVVNAIKFSPEREVVDIRLNAPSPGSVRLSVRDNGPGLNPEALRDCVERFHEGGCHTRSGTKGLGLGLSIARDLVELNLGSMMVQSTPGSGSTFSFDMPAGDRESIIRASKNRIVARDPEAIVSALRVKPQDPCHTNGQIMAFVSSVCHPTDVWLESHDGASIVGFGETSQPDAWKNRLLGAEFGHTHQKQQTGDALAIERVGTWSIREFSERHLLELLETAGVLR